MSATQICTMLSMGHSGKIQIAIHLSLVAPMPGRSRLPPCPPALPSQTFTFNDGTATPMPNGIPSNFIWSNAENAATPANANPPAMPFLTAAEIQPIIDWINNGCPNPGGS